MADKKSAKKGKISIKDLDLTKKSGNKTGKDPRASGPLHAVGQPMPTRLPNRR